MDIGLQIVEYAFSSPDSNLQAISHTTGCFAWLQSVYKLLACTKEEMLIHSLHIMLYKSSIGQTNALVVSDMHARKEQLSYLILYQTTNQADMSSWVLVRCPTHSWVQKVHFVMCTTPLLTFSGQTAHSSLLQFESNVCIVHTFVWYSFLTSSV